MLPEQDTTAFLQDFSKNWRKVAYAFIAILILIAILLLVAKISTKDEAPTSQDNLELKFTATQMPTLYLGHYAFWIVDSEENYHFFKRFNFFDGKLVSLDGTPLESWSEDIPVTPAQFVVTIEREGDRDEVPSDVIFLQSISTSELTTLQMVPDLEGISGSFILATPTDANTQINEQSGVWFVQEDLKSPSLQLPAVPEQWIWQAQVQSEHNGEYFIGNFLSNSGYDDFSDYSARKQQGFAFPGEDFLVNLAEAPLNLANNSYEVIVSLEPVLAGADLTGNTAFLPVLTATIPAGQSIHKSIAMQAQSIQIELQVEVL